MLIMLKTILWWVHRCSSFNWMKQRGDAGSERLPTPLIWLNCHCHHHHHHHQHHHWRCHQHHHHHNYDHHLQKLMILVPQSWWCQEPTDMRMSLFSSPSLPSATLCMVSYTPPLPSSLILVYHQQFEQFELSLPSLPWPICVRNSHQPYICTLQFWNL